MLKFLRKIESLILKAEYIFVILLLLMICFLAFSQVILRNLPSFAIEWAKTTLDINLGPFVWADIVVRMGVLWVAILGASIATSEKGHIHIDLLSRIVPPPFNKYLDAFLSLVAAGACFFFFFVALKFVSVEKEVGSVIHLLRGAPEWVFTLIFPIGFIMMSFKFLLCFFTDLGGKEREAE